MIFERGFGSFAIVAQFSEVLLCRFGGSFRQGERRHRGLGFIAEMTRVALIWKHNAVSHPGLA